MALELKYETVTQHFNDISSKMNKTAKHSKLYSSQNDTSETLREEEDTSYKLPEPSRVCKNLREKSIKKHKGLFKEVLRKQIEQADLQSHTRFLL